LRQRWPNFPNWEKKVNIIKAGGPEVSTTGRGSFRGGAPLQGG